MKDYSIGIDLGGTKILASAVNIKTGEIVSEVKNKTRKIRGNKSVLEVTKETVRELLKKPMFPGTG